MPAIKFNPQYTIKYETDAVTRAILRMNDPHVYVHNVNDQDKTKMVYFRGTCVVECNTKSQHLRVVYYSESLLPVLNEILTALDVHFHQQ